MLDSFSYQLNGTGQRTGITDADGTISSYEYDAIHLNGKSGKTKIDLGSLDPKIPKGKILIDVFVDKQGSIHHATPIIIGR